MLAPPVECNVAADFQPVIDKTVVRTEAGIGFLEVTTFYNTIMVEITERE